MRRRGGRGWRGVRRKEREWRRWEGKEIVRNLMEKDAEAVESKRRRDRGQQQELSDFKISR